MECEETLQILYLVTCKFMRIAILGYGLEGKSALRFFRREVRSARLEVRDIKLQGRNYLKGLEKFDMIVRSPGVPYLTPEIQRAKKAGVEVTSATKLFFKYARGKIIGITGTKGKGTVATLFYKILKAAGKDAHLVGNMGVPMLDELPKLKKKSISVLELSSFQLQDLDYSPDIAVILDITPDHLNYHRSFREYLNAKAKIVENHSPNPPLTFYFPNNRFSKLIAQKSRGKKVAVLPNKSLILKLPGFHNLKNISMAAVVAASLGVSQKIIKNTIKNFKGLPHRLEFVREVLGVKYYNDSAATNPAATIAALKSFDQPKILIAGGQGKNLSYKPLGAAIKKSNVKYMILFGKNKLEIKKAVAGAAPIKLVSDLKSAVRIASKVYQNGDVVLLSPASTAFGEFLSYAERGEYFKKLVRAG